MAKPSKLLSPLQAATLRLCLGALRSPAPSGTGFACHSIRAIALQGLAAPAIHPVSKLRGILADRVKSLAVCLADPREPQSPALDADPNWRLWSSVSPRYEHQGRLRWRGTRTRARVPRVPRSPRRETQRPRSFALAMPLEPPVRLPGPNLRIHFPADELAEALIGPFIPPAFPFGLRPPSRETRRRDFGTWTPLQTV
jgi:hypothetical protein